METETGSEAAKPESNLRKVLSAKDILDGNIGQDSESTAVTPYEGDAAMAAMAAMAVRQSAAARENILSAASKAINSIDLSSLHNIAKIASQIKTSNDLLSEISSSSYLNQSRPYPASFYNVSSIVEPLENIFEPKPTGGIECFRFYATGGTAVQAGNVLYDEFSPLKEPLCFLIPHNDLDEYWHIYVYDGDVSEAREWHIAGQDVEDYQEYLTYGGEGRVKLIGYVYVSDRPKIKVVFYVYDEADQDLAKSLAHRAANELEQSGFDLFAAVMDESSLPDGAVIFDSFDRILFRATTDELVNLVRAYLQAEGHVTDSVSLERKVYDKQICIQYPFDDCIIRLKTDSEEFGETYIKPDIHCWETKPLEREKKLTNAQQHVIVLLKALKHKIRWIPQKPKSVEDWDAWFDYLHECEEASFDYDLQDLAKDISKSYGYVRQKHSEYMAGKEI